MNQLQIIEHEGERVITTVLLAQAYNTQTNNIHMNFARNPDRFTAGKHYFKLEGFELQTFKSKPTVSGSVALDGSARGRGRAECTRGAREEVLQQAALSEEKRKVAPPRKG